MSEFEFVIPLQKDELLESHVGQYHVEDITPPRVLTSKLQDAARGFNVDGVEYILEHFDTYYSILVHGGKLEWPIINKAFDHIDRAAKKLCPHLEVIFQEKEIDTDVRTKNLNCVKMILYLFTSIMKVKDSKLATENSTKLSLGKKKRAGGVNVEENGEWSENDKHMALVTLFNVLHMPLARLWDPPLAEDNFVSMVAEPCYKTLEEQIIKNKTVRETVFQVIGVLIKKYNHGTSSLIKLVQVLQLVEHAMSPICAGVVQLCREFGLTTFGPQMAREIAEALTSNGDVETRYCGLFLMELTKELPQEMAGAIATLQPHLESDESYTLRVSVLGMMCEVLCSELRGEELSESQKAQRDDFLEDLEEHIHDLSAHVRSKVLQYWCRLQREQCVPVARLRSVMEKAAGRLKDRAALVRKAAIQLLKIFLEFNPFSAQLELNVLEEKLTQEKEILDELQNKLDRGPDPQRVKKWEKMEPKIIDVVNEKLDQLTQDDPLLSQASLDDIYASIRRHLDEKNYYTAFMIVRHAERQYPDAKLLRSNLDKTDQIGYFIALLRNVYVVPDKRESLTLTQECENELSVYKKIEEKEQIVAFLEESVYFSRILSQAVPLINALLASKQAGDVSEAIEFFTAAHHFNIESARVGIASMLLLVWSPDQDKCEAVERAYADMYLQTDAKTERAQAFAIAKNLVNLVKSVNRGHALALQHLLAKWVEKGSLSPAVIQVFWEIFSKKIDGTTDMESFVALSILAMISKAKPSVTLANLEVIQDYGLVGDYNTRSLSVELLLSLGKKSVRYPEDHVLLKKLYVSIVDTFLTMKRFTTFAGRAIDAIYEIFDKPEVLCARLLQELSSKLEETAEKENEELSYSVEYLTRFIFLLGHIAMRQLIYLDVNVYSELRRRNQIREERKVVGKKKKQLATPARNKGGADALRRQTLMHNISTSSASCRNQRSASVTSQVSKSANTAINDDDSVALEGAVADDADAEYIRAVCSNHIVMGDAALAPYVALLREILVNPSKYSDEKLRSAAALTLCRYMLVSPTLCDDNMQLLITVLKRTHNSSIRSNIIISFADLTLRFPNIIQPWTQHVYERLHDRCVIVRQCTVKMLSFLILHEMVRVKGQIADMALCCVDVDSTVSSMTRTFFKQLSCKGNSLYNVMPDIISRLSDPTLKVEEEDFRTIMKYITSLIQKDRQMEALVEKLCHRFKLSTEERQWRDLAYCLSLFNYNERSIRKLIENMDCFKDKLYCKGVYESFRTLMSNASKLAKPDMKALVTELNDKIEECFAVQEGEEDKENASMRTSVVSSARKQRPARSKACKRAGRRVAGSSSEDEGSDDENVQINTSKSTKRSNRRTLDLESSDDELNPRSQLAKDAHIFKRPTRRTAVKRK